VKSLAKHRRHPAAVLVVIMLGLLLTGGLYAAANTATEARSVEADALLIEEGKRLFLEGCSSCHGLAGQGSDNGPSLIGVGAAAVDFQVGTGRMPLANFGAQAPSKAVEYTDEQIRAIAAFVASLAPGPSIPSAEDLDYTGVNVARGGELFRANCSQCHQAAGRGGALSNGQYAPNLMKTSPEHIWEAMLTGPQQMPVFADTTLPPQDKKEIISYIESIRASDDPGGWALGRFGPVTEGLFVWIGGMLLAVILAVWIGAKVR
jgi:ubiquinol-cytochrome c reductase cytochrome c subunit